MTREWELAEKPIAYVRKGDPVTLLKAFEQADCEVKEHQFGYRSIHYLVKSKPAKRVCVGEIQIRTIFEEGWSEIDHRVRYPRLSDDPYLAEFLTIFNRLAGSSDEMGTFVRGLSNLIYQHTVKVAEKDQQTMELETQLKSTISKLEISKKDKASLERQVNELRKHSQQSPRYGLGEAASAIGALSTLPASPAYFSSGLTLGATLERNCSKCGKKFVGSSLFLAGDGDRCLDCRNGFLLGH